MTEDASRPEDTQEAERGEESSEGVASVEDPDEPVTVAPEGDGEDDGGAGETADADAGVADAETVDADGDVVEDGDEDAPDAGAEPSASDEAGSSASADRVEGVTVEPDDVGADAGAEADQPELGSDAGAESDADGRETVDDGDGDDEAEETDAESEEADVGPEVAEGESQDADAGDVAGSPEAPAGAEGESADASEPTLDLPADVRKYDRFTKMDGAQYDRVNDFLRDRTYITAREWAIARLCADFRTETGVEMTKIGENLPHLVPFMTDTYSPQAVNQARSAFEEKVQKAGATFLYGAMCDFFTADELDDLMYEVTEVAKFLLEVEGVDLTVEEELEAEERISTVMREVRQSSDQLRHEGVCCPECGHEFEAEGHETD
jgi:hypothetical protein